MRQLDERLQWRQTVHSVANTVGTEDDCRQDKTTQNPNRGQISGEGANVRRRRAGLCGPGGDVAGRSPDRGGGGGAGSWSRVGGRRQTAERRRQTQPGTVSSLAHRPSVPLPRRFHRLHRIFAILTTSASPSPHGISIGSAAFAALADQKHTDHGTCDVCSNRPQLRDACDAAFI